MNTFELKIFDDEGNKCTFYTVLCEDAEFSETDKFIKKFQSHVELKESLQDLFKFITIIIGDEKGARSDYFKPENEAQALPPSKKFVVEEVSLSYVNFPLRLYCYRISDNLVILFNGGEKTDRTAQGGKTSMAFYEATQFAKKINQALTDGTIYITENGRELRYYNHSLDIIL